jgi:phytoene dehydrogenase-like protein
MADQRDVIVVGGGHNGLVAAAYLARAGRSVLVLERGPELGGAAVSFRAFPGVDVRLSRYSYLVSLLPKQIIDELGLPIRLHRRAVSSYTPVPGDPARGLLVHNGDDAATAAAFRRVTGGDADLRAWREFYAMTGRVARAVFPTLTEPLPTAAELRARIDDEHAWRALFAEPLSVELERVFGDDTVRGVALTDALIGTFATAEETELRQNRCFLYHVIGNGTGDWDVPIGGMGAVTAALVAAARSAGAELVTGAEVTAVDPDGSVHYELDGKRHSRRAGHVLANVAPATLSRLLGEEPAAAPEGAQLKVNMVLRALPRLREDAVDPVAAFGGTFHVNEGYRQLAAAHAQAAAGQVPDLPPCEIYCHSLADPSILGPAERAAGVQTLTLFGLHMPARLFRTDSAAEHDAVRDRALRATLDSLNSVLAQPIEECLLRTPDGEPCVEAKTPVDLEREVGLPGGHIFHQDLDWPLRAEDGDGEPDRWGVRTAHRRILRCGAGAVRGGGVSGLGGHNAARHVLEQ